jgi:hypothetical protein
MALSPSRVTRFLKSPDNHCRDQCAATWAESPLATADSR